jgi:hypothetical protein
LYKFDFIQRPLQLSGEIFRIARPTNGLFVEHFTLSKLKGLASLHHFDPEEIFSSILIELFVAFRGLEWVFFMVLKKVPVFHQHVRMSDYDSCHFANLSFPNERAKV